LIRAEVQQFCEMQVGRVGNTVSTRQRLHTTAIVWLQSRPN
jgi:hypothetical protein